MLNTIIACVRDDHDLRLVLAAAAICLASAATAFFAYPRARSATGSLRLAWTIFIGFVAGAGVWATHFMAMLAYQPGLQIRYEPLMTVASLAASIFGMAVGFGIAASRRASVSAA